MIIEFVWYLFVFFVVVVVVDYRGYCIDMQCINFKMFYLVQGVIYQIIIDFMMIIVVDQCILVLVIVFVWVVVFIEVGVVKFCEVKFIGWEMVWYLVENDVKVCCMGCIDEIVEVVLCIKVVGWCVEFGWLVVLIVVKWMFVDW